MNEQPVVKSERGGRADGFFDDIEFIAADDNPRCDARIDRRFERMFNLQYIAGGTMWLGVDGEPERLLGAGTAFWHHPAHRYRYRPGEGGWWHHYWVTFRGPRARRLLEGGLLGLSDAHWLAVADPAGFERSMGELVGRVAGGSAGGSSEGARAGRGRAVVLLEGLLCDLLDSVRGPGWADGTRAAALRRLGERIEAAPQRRWDFQAEAARVHVSYPHFRRLFARELGAPPLRFVLDARMRLAGRLLADPSRQVKDVAAELGYDPPAFAKLFHRRMGLWPGEFRRQLPTGSGDSPDGGGESG
jgi:AraC-like DNA-binding protein